MIEKIIRSKISGGLKTRVDFYPLEKEEVACIACNDEAEFNRLLTLRSFEEATEQDLIDWLNRDIPIVTDNDEVEIVTNIANSNPVEVKEEASIEDIADELRRMTFSQLRTVALEFAIDSTDIKKKDLLALLLKKAGVEDGNTA